MKNDQAFGTGRAKFGLALNVISTFIGAMFIVGAIAYAPSISLFGAIFTGTFGALFGFANIKDGIKNIFKIRKANAAKKESVKELNNEIKEELEEEINPEVEVEKVQKSKKQTKTVEKTLEN